jgi:DMSO/TMAO reductase YedYZ molybdopterin-dependent catalytic subunit
MGDMNRRDDAAAALWGAGVGLFAAGALHLLVPRFPFPVIAVAERIATMTPGGIATFFIEALQHLALPLTVIVAFAGTLLVTWALGRWALPGLEGVLGRRLAAVAGAVPLWLAAVVAYEPDASTVPRTAYALLLGACAGIGAAATSRMLVASRERATAFEVVGMDRRAVVRGGLLGLAGLALGWFPFGRLFGNGVKGPLPVRAAMPAAVLSPGAGFDSIPGLAPRITPLDRFYTVDEEIVDPDVDTDSWTLSIGGHVQRPFELTYDELLAMPLAEQHATMACISNPVGGDLISTSTWTGVRLRDLLERAGVREGALEVVSTAVGGYSDSLPIDDALRPVTLVAIGMDGQTLPRAHGYPARLLAPGYYGMKQPKWLRSIEVVDVPYDGYWERRGWIKAAVVKTWSRIDTVDRDRPQWIVAGVAFAGDRRVEHVEVSLDGGRTWRDADLERPLSGLTWARWKLDFDPADASEVLVRATDGDGATQVEAPSAPHPSGATGYPHLML